MMKHLSIMHAARRSTLNSSQTELECLSRNLVTTPDQLFAVAYRSGQHKLFNSQTMLPAKPYLGVNKIHNIPQFTLSPLGGTAASKERQKEQEGFKEGGTLARSRCGANVDRLSF